MVINRDEAERSRDIGIKHLRSGDFLRAKKFLEKSMRLFPLDGVEGLLAQVEKSIERQNEKDEAAKRKSAEGARQRSQDQPQSEFRHRHTRQSGTPSSSDGSGSSNAPKAAPCAAARKILEAKTYYEVLGVSRESSESEIKKAYKKLALKFHPDKNQEPGAEDAFKQIGRAFACLSDERKRRIYEQTGRDSDQPQISGGGGGMHARFAGGPSDDEIFNMFFQMFGGVHPQMRRGGVYTSRGGGFRYAGGGFRRHQHEERQEPQSAFGVLMSLCSSLLPLLVLMMFYIVSSANFSSPVYSLRPTGEYRVSLKTSEEFGSITYYVRPGFSFPLDANGDDEDGRRELEQEVYAEYEQSLRKFCQREQHAKRERLSNASWMLRKVDRERARAQAERMPMPNCNALQELRQRMKAYQESKSKAKSRSA